MKRKLDYTLELTREERDKTVNFKKFKKDLNSRYEL